MNEVKVVICYGNEPMFDEFLDMTENEVYMYGVESTHMYSLDEFQRMCNTDDYINTSSYIRFIED